MKIYLLSTGEYSDYNIRAAFSTRELADATAVAYGNDANQIEEFEVDVPSKYPAGMSSWVVCIDPDTGDVGHTWLGDPEHFEEKLTAPGTGAFPSKQLVVRTWARDREHAIKIANEKRLQFIASK